MSDWTAGYVADIGYTFGYYAELNPLRIKLAFINAGMVAPEVGSACELGFGQGVSTNLHAAASVTQWHGTDFNPSQAGFAQELAERSGSGAQLRDDAFAEFCSRPDLPDFDYIGLHGIWSWISDANRAVIVDFVRRKLKVGGVLYISYNTLPGWSTFAPLRHLMTQHAALMGANGTGIVNRIDDALAFTDRFLSTNPMYARANPSVQERQALLKAQNRNYLAHEYFNADWHPMYFADMAKWLSPGKVSFACSAHMQDHLPLIHITAEQQSLLKELPNEELRQTVWDFMVNQQFRRDYWVKGIRRLSVPEQAQALRSLRVVLSSHWADVPMKVKGALGEASLADSIYTPILNVMADHQVRSVGEIEQCLQPNGIELSTILEAMLLLCGVGHVHLAQTEAVASKAKPHTEKLNNHLLNKAQFSSDVNHLASPVTGGGVTVNRFCQLFLLARSQGAKQPTEWAQFTWNLLAAQGQRIIKDDKQLETAEENLDELNAQAQTFADKQLPILEALQIA